MTEALRDTHTQMKHRKERKAELLPATQHMRLHLLKGKSVHLVSNHNEVLIRIYIYIINGLIRIKDLLKECINHFQTLNQAYCHESRSGVNY